MRDNENGMASASTVTTGTAACHRLPSTIETICGDAAAIPHIMGTPRTRTTMIDGMNALRRRSVSF